MKKIDNTYRYDKMKALYFKGEFMFKLTKRQWITVFACFLLLAINLGAFNSSTSVYVTPVTDELNFGLGEFTFYRTITSLVGALLMPLYGTLLKKYGIKRVMLISTILQGLFFSLYGFSTELWHFYFIAGLQGLVLNGVSFMSVGVVINKWFDKNKGFAGAIAFSGSGMGTAFLAPLLTVFVEEHGWRVVMFWVGIVAALIAIPIILFMISDEPEVDKSSGNVKKSSGSGYTASKAFGMLSFWALAVAFFLLGFSSRGGSVLMQAYLQYQAYTAEFASFIFSMSMILLTVGKLVLGPVYDKFGISVGNFVVCLSMLLYPIMAYFAGVNEIFPWLYALFLGFGSAGVSVPLTILVSDCFGDRDFVVIFGRLNAIGAIGMAIGAPVIGYIYDFTGNYDMAWLGLVVFAIISFVALVISHRRSKMHKIQ